MCRAALVQSALDWPLRAPRSYWQIHWQMWGPEGYRGGLSLLRISNLLI